ncbi:hypothetical protein HW556_09440 [Hymenobacter sp. P5252]|uniref:Uncharacterized protein n=1 Tax=Hymenobacter terrestris TaxID=2748310 RepID=A0ABX2Q3H6_9BACT|nr:hypothetical protein [Hymenobacter terrestris]
MTIVEMPPVLMLTNWKEFTRYRPRNMQILRQVMQGYAETMAPKRIMLA